ncbi:MAG: hypothetical protein RBT36_09315 [Desulfobulbus sp.]|jgi:hypothetical protein|nr:hypothetical protein [Desulfobulbus sp.]
MVSKQRARIVESVRAGRTWSEAAEAAGIKAEALLQYVFDVRQGKQADPAGFVKALEEAGKHATEQAISTTRRELKVPKNDSGQAENNEETVVCKRRPYFRRLANLTDLRKVQAKLLRMFLNDELDEKTYRATVYGTTAIGTTMRYMDQQRVEAKQASHGLLFGRLTATGEFNEPIGAVFLGMGNDDERITEQEAVE